MYFWIFIITVLFIQEPASTDAAIFLIRQHDINIWLINAIWILATTIDICAGYVVGKWIQKRFQGTKFSIWSERWANKIENFIGKKGERFAIVLLGVINFPYVNSFFISWLKLPFRNVFILLFVGDLMYWIIAWLINISIRNYFSNPHTVLYIVIGIGLLISIVSKFVLTKILKKS